MQCEAEHKSGRESGARNLISNNFMFLSIVIPAFNEEKALPIFLKELEIAVKKCKDVARYEIIIIDDHSTDDTFRVIKNLAKKNIKIIRLSRRSGSHVALRAGLMQAKGTAALCLAADGQDDPAVIPAMVGKILNEKNVVWAVRHNRQEPFGQKIFAQLFYRLLTFFTENINPAINLANADFYLIDRRVIDAINSCPERNTSLFGLIIWLGFDQDFVSYMRRARAGGSSKWNFKSRLKLATDWIIAFSGIPLKIIVMLGLFFSILGMLYTVFIFVYVILGYAKPGWAEPVVLILVTGGIQMTMLGVIGEYLQRTLDETRKRPLFFVENQA